MMADALAEALAAPNTTAALRWSPQQDAALKAVADWLKAPGRQVFRLFGYAGTGKTTLARHFAEGVDGGVLFGAFTGKAALVLRSKGCENASTIHSMIYKVEDDNYGNPRFVLNEESPVDDAELVIIDECSMVGEEIGKDLLSFGKPVLVLGDPAQLPPVKGAGFFTEHEPDIMLTEIHRQARENPIISLATTVREGGRLEYGDYGQSRVIGREAVDRRQVLDADQILVGKNDTRMRYNRRIRELWGRLTPTPQVGERLVCLRNKRDKGLLNGGIWTVAALIEPPRPKRRRRKTDAAPPEEAVWLQLLSEDVGGRPDPVDVAVHPYFFAGREDELEWEQRKKFDEFTYGYALTVHKAQGSQWDNVIVFDESGVFREDRHRWLYTAITRAAERVTVVQ